MSHRQEDVDITPRIGLKMQRGVIDHGDVPGIDNNQAGPLLNRPYHFITKHRMRFGGVGAGDKNAIRITNFPDGVGHGTTAKTCRQTGDSGAVSQPGAVVNCIGPYGRPHEFLEDIVIFIGAAGRSQPGHSIGAVSLNCFSELRRYNLGCLFPRNRDVVV